MLFCMGSQFHGATKEASHNEGRMGSSSQPSDLEADALPLHHPLMVAFRNRTIFSVSILRVHAEL